MPALLPYLPQNALRLTTITIIGDLLLLLAKITVAAGCGLIAFGMSETKFYSDPDEYPETHLSRCGAHTHTIT